MCQYQKRSVQTMYQVLSSTQAETKQNVLMPWSCSIWDNWVSAVPSPQSLSTLVWSVLLHCVQHAVWCPYATVYLFCLLRCCSWYSLESSQGRGPRMFFHSSKFFSCNFCKKKQNNRKGLAFRMPIIQYLKPSRLQLQCLVNWLVNQQKIKQQLSWKIN